MQLFIRYTGNVNDELDGNLMEIFSALGFECTDARYDKEGYRDLDFETYEDLKINGDITLH